jgi:hypothetical protein
VEEGAFSTTIQMNIDVTKLTVRELRNLYTNSQKLGRTATVNAVLKEMWRRIVAKRGDFRALKWNQDSVCEVMQPFKNIAGAVNGNQRTVYTEAGGGKKGRSNENSEKVWIDTYSAIKTFIVNAMFVCTESSSSSHRSPRSRRHLTYRLYS